MAAETTQAKITHRLGSDAWTCFGVYRYTHPCRQCVCGHRIQNVFVIVREGDHGPAWGEYHELGSECIKFVAKTNPTLFGDLMRRKAEWEKVQRELKQQRIEDMLVDPECRRLRQNMRDFLTVAEFVSNEVYPSSFRRPTRLQQFCKRAGIEFNEQFWGEGRFAAGIYKARYEVIEQAQFDEAKAALLLAGIREKLVPLVEALRLEFSGKSDCFPGARAAKIIIGIDPK